MGRVQMSTEEKTGRRARDRKKKNWREESFETTKSHSRPAVSRMSASILLLAGLLFMVTGCSPQRPLGPSAVRPRGENTGGLLIRGH